eukprot:UN04520
MYQGDVKLNCANGELTKEYGFCTEIKSEFRYVLHVTDDISPEDCDDVLNSVKESLKLAFQGYDNLEIENFVVQSGTNCAQGNTNSDENDSQSVEFDVSMQTNNPELVIDILEDQDSNYLPRVFMFLTGGNNDKLNDIKVGNLRIILDT